MNARWRSPACWTNSSPDEFRDARHPPRGRLNLVTLGRVRFFSGRRLQSGGMAASCACRFHLPLSDVPPSFRFLPRRQKPSAGAGPGSCVTRPGLSSAGQRHRHLSAAERICILGLLAHPRASSPRGAGPHLPGWARAPSTWSSAVCAARWERPARSCRCAPCTAWAMCSWPGYAATPPAPRATPAARLKSVRRRVRPARRVHGHRPGADAAAVRKRPPMRLDAGMSIGQRGKPRRFKRKSATLMRSLRASCSRAAVRNGGWEQRAFYLREGIHAFFRLSVSRLSVLLRRFPVLLAACGEKPQFNPGMPQVSVITVQPQRRGGVRAARPRGCSARCADPGAGNRHRPEDRLRAGRRRPGRPAAVQDRPGALPGRLRPGRRAAQARRADPVQRHASWPSATRRWSKANAVSKQEYDNAVARYRQADASVAAAKANLDQCQDQPGLYRRDLAHQGGASASRW